MSHKYMIGYFPRYIFFTEISETINFYGVLNLALRMFGRARKS